MNMIGGLVDSDIPWCRRLSQWNMHDLSSNFDLIHYDDYSKNFAMWPFIGL